MFAMIKKSGQQEYIGIYKAIRKGRKTRNILIKNYGNIKKFKGKNKQEIINMIMEENSMLLKDIKVGQGQINMNLTIIELKEVNKRDDGQSVQTAIVEDAQANTARLDLWNNNANKFSVGQKVKIIKGYARSEYEGILNITLGKYGDIIIVGE